MKPPTFLQFRSLSDLVDLLERKATSPVEVTQDLLGQIKRVNSSVRAWETISEEVALQNAMRVNDIFGRPNYNKRLCGIPIGIKDIFNTEDFPTQMGSPIWKGFAPGNDARVVFNLRYEDGNIIGKTVTSEFAVHGETQTRNPFDLRRSCGTSSAGSAAAVASGMVPVALATQTGASIIRPASFCGVFGFKPTFGTIPRTGVLKTSDTLDSIGMMARDIRDLRLVFDVTRVSGRNYPFVNRNFNDVPLPKPAKLGTMKGPYWEKIQPDVQGEFIKFIDRLDGLEDIDLIEYEIPRVEEIAELHELIYCKSLSYYFKREHLDRMKLSPRFKEMLDRGDQISPEEFLSALKKQAEWISECDSKFSCDAWLTLAAAGGAPFVERPVELEDLSKVFTFLGLPSLTLPVLQESNGMPVGIQVVGKKYSDFRILALSQRILDQLEFSWKSPE